MSDHIERHHSQVKRLAALAESRHVASVACHRAASATRTVEDRIVYEEMARRIAEEAEALKRRLAIWKQPAA